MSGCVRRCVGGDREGVTGGDEGGDGVSTHFNAAMTFMSNKGTRQVS